MKGKRLLFCIFSIFFTVCVQAVPARPGYYKLIQPDGSSINARLTGDEFFKLLTTETGSAIIKDRDGWYSYAFFTEDGRRYSSGIHVSDRLSPAAAEARNIPYTRMKQQASEQRALRGSLNQNRIANGIDTKAGSGKIKALIILAQFSDLKFNYGKSNFENMLTKEGYDYNGATGSALDYFKAQFGDSKEFEFVVSDIVTLSHGYAYYGENGDNGLDKRAAEAVAEACKLVDAKMNFSEFDTDDDGEVDNVFLFVAGRDEAEGAGDDHIWSHQWYLADGAGIKLSLDGKILNKYAVSTEISLDENGQDCFTTIGTFCHEFSHTLGLSDMYDTDYEDSEGTSIGLWGRISIMDYGSYNNGGNTPPNYCALELDTVGVGNCLTLETGEVTLLPLSQEKSYYKMASDVPGEYWLFECRDNLGWDEYLGGRGLLIYHIDKSLQKAGYSDTYQMNMTAAKRWYYNEVNCWPKHQCAYLAECVQGTGSISQVFWPNGSRNAFSGNTTPAFQHWSGRSSELSILNIRNTGDGVSFTVAGPISIGKVEPFQDAAIVQWSMAGGGAETLSYISLTGSDGQVIEGDVEPYSTGLYSYTFEGLSEKTTYSVKVSTKKGGSGDCVESEFTTKAFYNDGYPFIYLNSADRDSEGYFVWGSQMPLRVFNARNCARVSWTFEGRDIEDDGSGYWTVKNDGLLKAYIDYQDGSSEIISKRITVK